MNLPAQDDQNQPDSPGVPSAEEVKSAFAEAGLTVSVEQRTLALTASADGGVLFGIFIVVAISEFAKLMADDAYAGLKRLLQRFRGRGSVEYVVYVSQGGVDARIDSDLPPEAFLKLQGPLPNAPSGRVVYNRDAGSWQDSEE